MSVLCLNFFPAYSSALWFGSSFFFVFPEFIAGISQQMTYGPRERVRTQSLGLVESLNSGKEGGRVLTSVKVSSISLARRTIS